MPVKIKRIYEPSSPSDGYRILVDRLWPRGIKKESAHIDQWMKEVAPSTELRKWFNHDPGKWNDFRKKYHTELKDSASLKELKENIHRHKTVTLLFGAKEEKYNHAAVLKELMSR